MNPYLPPSQTKLVEPIKDETSPTQRDKQALVLMAWVTASVVTTVLFMAAFLFVSGQYAGIVAVSIIAFVGCLTPWILIRIGRRFE